VSLFERFSRNASYMVGGTVLQRLLLGVGAVIYARLLGAEQYGIYVNVFSLVTILTAVCQFGVPSSFTAILPQVETTSPHRAPLVVGAGLALVGGFLTASALILWRGAGFLSSVVYHDQIPRLLFLLAIPFLLAWTMQTVLASVLQGFQHFRFHAVQSVALGLFIVAGSVAGILLDNVRGALVGASIGYAAGLALVFRYVHRHWGIRFQGFDGAFRATLSEVRAFAVPAFIGGLFVAPAYWIGNVLLVRAGGVHWSGIYGVANTLAQLALFIPVVLALAESVGTQSVSLTLQMLHGRPPSWRWIGRELRRELMTGMMLAGLVANANWFTHMTIAQSLPMLTPYFIVRAIGGGIVVVSAFMFAIDIIMTILYKPRMTQPQILTTGGAI